MPYVPSKKTDGKSEDREVIDAAVEVLAQNAATSITNNLSLIKVYKAIFLDVAARLATYLFLDRAELTHSPEDELAFAIYILGKKYDYEGAYLGEFNYAFTRFIQRVPGIKVEKKEWIQELRYWIYAATVEALTFSAKRALFLEIGIGGVFEDIKDEYKRRVNTAYEAEQILKNGDCYNTPYYTRLVPVVDENGNLVGHMEIMLKRDAATLTTNLLPMKIVVKS